MDLVLLVGSSSVAARLPFPFRDNSNKNDNRVRRYNDSTTTEERLFRWILFTSLCLFSLCTLDTLPKDSPLLLLLAKDNQQHSSSLNLLYLSTAYKILLWALCFLITILAPAVGCYNTFFIPKIHHDGDAGTKQKSYSSFFQKVASSGVRVAVQICHVGQKLWTRFVWKKKNIKTVLPRVISDNNIHRRNQPIQKSSRICILGYFGSAIIIGAYYYRQHNTTQYYFQWWVAKLCSIGVFLSSLLDGFGSVSMVYASVAGFILPDVPEDAIQIAENEVQLMTRELETQKKELQQSCNDNRLQQDVRILDNLVCDLMEDLEDLKYIQTLSQSSQSRWGRFRFWIGAIVSIILSIRLFMACRNSIIPSSNTTNNKDDNKNDPITFILLWLVGHDIVNSTQYDSTSQFVSLFLTAFLCMSQIRNVSRILHNIHRRIRDNVPSCSLPISSCSRGTKSFGSCSLSSIMGCYFLSCVVSIKGNVPVSYQTSFRRALFGDLSSSSSAKMTSLLLDTTIRNRTFVSSAILATIMVTLSHSIQRKLCARVKTCEWKTTQGAFFTV